MNGQTPFDPYAYVKSMAPAQGTQPPAFDPYAYAAGATPQTEQQSTPQPSPELPHDIGTPFGQVGMGIGEGLVVPTAGAIAGGLRGMWDLAMGKGGQQAAADVEKTQAAAQGLIQPTSKGEQIGEDIAQSNWNPLNWPGIVLNKAGESLGKAASDVGAPAWFSTGLRVLPMAVGAALPLKGAFKGAESAEIPTMEESAAKPEATNAPLIKTGKAPEAEESPVVQAESAKAEDATSAERKSILERVGLKSIRQSALSGDAKDAATDFQMTRYDQPAGRAAASQFAHERDALTSHAENIVHSTGGTLGMDEDALANKGSVIDKPFALARQWFDGRIRDAYAAADAQSQGIPINLMNFRNVLRDDSLMTNQDRVALRNGINAYLKQLDMVDEQPGQFYLRGNVANAETVRKYLNAEWSPANSRFVGQLKDALDEDVTKAAGSDIYQQARAVRALKARILEDPKGVSKLFETDPNTPINRATPFARLPQQLMNLDPDQFGNVLSILREMPDEIQPAAQQALGEIRGYLANKLLQAGTQTSAGNMRALWNGSAVSNVLKTNSAKFRLAFQDDPEALSKIDDLNKAGQILKVDATYPGADAQAANAMKRGLLSRAIPYATRVGGAAVGGMFGGVGAAGGAMAGEVLGEPAGLKAAEKSALKAWQKRTVPAGD